jgi:hypothetical protein
MTEQGNPKLLNDNLRGLEEEHHGKSNRVLRTRELPEKSEIGSGFATWKAGRVLHQRKEVRIEAE